MRTQGRADSWRAGAELADLHVDELLRLLLRLARFGLRQLDLLAVVLDLRGRHEARLARNGRQHRSIGRLDEDLEVGHAAAPETSVRTNE
jgi:hypothetical protein